MSARPNEVAVIEGGRIVARALTSAPAGRYSIAYERTIDGTPVHAHDGRVSRSSRALRKLRGLDALPTAIVCERGTSIEARP